MTSHTVLKSPNKISRYLVYRDGQPVFGCLNYEHALTVVDSLKVKHPDSLYQVEIFGQVGLELI
jgi:hypothetical protein